MKVVITLSAEHDVTAISGVIDEGIVPLSTFQEVVSLSTDQGVITLACQKNVVRRSPFGKTYGLQ